ncbi:hypothetical protein BH11MYX2_BH11MYX2_21180 [soil metagenome]
MPEAVRTRAANLALALAITSSVVVVAAIVVTVARSHARTERSRHPRADKIDRAGALVRAADIIRLEAAVESSGDGIRVTDRALAAALRVRDADVVTAISGRIVRSTTDVTTAVSSMFMLDPSAIYVDIVRDGTPLLLKWQIDGDLRDALTSMHRDLTKKRNNGLAAGVVGGLSGAPTSGMIDPFATAHASNDPLVSTITMLSVDHFALPAATFRTLFDDPGTAISSGVIASIKRLPVERDSRTVNRLFGIRPSTIWYALGLRNGDIVLSANGRTVDFSSLFDTTRHLTNADSIDVQIERSGASLDLHYDITP